MKTLNRIIDRIGLVILKPGESFDLIIVEGVSPKEGITVTALGVLMFSLVSTFFSSENPLKAFLTNFAAVLVFWLIFAFSLSSVIKVLYKVPGDFKEFISGLSYALSSTILLAVYLLVLVAVKPPFSVFLLGLSLTVGVIWFIWFVILVYKFTTRHFKIDLAQFFAAVIVAFVFVLVVLAIFAAIVASFLFLWWVF